MRLRLLFTIMFMLLFAHSSFAAVKKVGWITPILEVSAFGVLGLHNAPDKHVLNFNISEAVVGFETEIMDHVLIHASFAVEGDFENGEVEFGVAEVFGEVTFSKTVPFYIKAGQFDFGTVISDELSPFLGENNYITQLALLNTVAFEFGYKYNDTIHIGAGVYDARDGSAPKDIEKWFIRLKNYYAYINYNYVGDSLSFHANLGYTSNIKVGESSISDEGPVNNGTLELVFKYNEGHFLASFSFPAVVAARFEVAYDGESFMGGAYASFILGTSKSPTVELSHFGTTTNYDTPPVRVGAAFEYRAFEGFAVGLEGYYDIILNEPGSKKYDFVIVLSLKFELPEHQFYF